VSGAAHAKTSRPDVGKVVELGGGNQTFYQGEQLLPFEAANGQAEVRRLSVSNLESMSPESADASATTTHEPGPP
jgi:hypothetical protein